MNISRREFMWHCGRVSAAAALTGLAGAGTLWARKRTLTGEHAAQSRPNILLLMVDQMQTPPEGYSADQGMAQGLKEILGFRPLSEENAYSPFFQGLLRLRQNGVVCRKHYTASAACVPSRTAIMTGQYAGATGVDQTDGTFKSHDDVPWLDAQGTPTIGDWFRAAGYSTHYFGKWHVSHAEEPDYLDPWGFADWDKSYPEPHGSNPDNAGVYRDSGFAQNAVDFLDRKGTDDGGDPWFAVGSLTNPHDFGLMPVGWQLPADGGVVPWPGGISLSPMPIPAQGDQSLPGGDGEIVDLNPDGFPQDNSALPPTYDESLDDKPRCQKDYALKMGLAFKSMQEYNFAQQGLSMIKLPQPYQLQENAKEWFLASNQFYAYCHYIMDLQLRKILQALDRNNLAGNTIVVFLSDHGEMTAAHGGMTQKWHNAYEEAIRVPMVVSSPLVNSGQEMREILQPTSSIDLAPTLLGLAGYTQADLRAAMEAACGESVVKSFVGSDLSSHIRGESDSSIVGPDGSPRTGVFFMTNDTITDLGANPSEDTLGQYDTFVANVETLRAEGYDLASGSVTQPNCIRAFCTGDWKIVRYVDPKGVEADEWELYCLTSDPIERVNLVDYKTGEIRTDASVPGMTAEELIAKNNELKEELARQEAAMLGETA
ncbi:MAG: sulfatase-like hydrolase/transferase [Solirubrobacterales bacterium]